MTRLNPSAWPIIVPSGGKHRVRACGIYAILNVVSGKMYIGSSLDIANRLSDHRGALRHSRHYNAHLQAAWQRFGEAAFSYRIVTECGSDRLAKTEQAYIDALLSMGPRAHYNLSRDTVSPMRGRHHTEEWKRRLSVSMRGNTYASGRKQTKEEIARRAVSISRTLTGRPLSDEHRAALRRGWEKRRKWWTPSPETRAKIGESSRRAWKDAAYRETQIRNARAMWRRPGHRKTVSRLISLGKTSRARARRENTA